MPRNAINFISIVTLLAGMFPSNYSFAQGLGSPPDFSVQGKRAPLVVIPPNWEPVEVKSLFQGPARRDDGSGYCILKKNCLESADSNVKTFEKIDELEIFISLDEYEPVTFEIYALEDLETVSLSATDLVNAGGQVIPKANIDLRIVSLFPKISGENRYKLLPLILEKQDYVNIEKGSSRQFWVTIYAPFTAKEGRYAGKICIKPKNISPKEITLKVNVIPVMLTKPEINYGMYYNMDNRWKGFYPENMKNDFIDIKEHGLNSLTIFQCPSVTKGMPARFDFDRPTTYFESGLDETMDLYLESGLNGPIPYLGVWYGLLGEISNKFGYKDNTPEFDKIYIEALNAIERHRETRGWPEFLYSPEDEPANTEKKFKSAQHNLQLIKAALPDNRTYMTLNGTLKGTNDNEALNHLVDVRCYLVLNKKVIKSAQEDKAEVWIYNGGSEGLHPILDRFFYGFYGIKSGAKGIYQWVYQWPSSLGVTPYDELSSGSQGWYYTYPSPEGPLPTPAWEAIREGIDDAKYLCTLQELVKKAKYSKNPQITNEVIKSEACIEQILDQINLNLGTPQQSAHAILGWAPYWKVEVLDGWRRSLIERISALNKLLKPE